eukprot:4609522-Pyramimonas_sp.AAC.1
MARIEQHSKSAGDAPATEDEDGGRGHAGLRPSSDEHDAEPEVTRGPDGCPVSNEETNVYFIRTRKVTGAGCLCDRCGYSYNAEAHLGTAKALQEHAIRCGEQRGAGSRTPQHAPVFAVCTRCDSTKRSQQWPTGDLRYCSKPCAVCAAGKVAVVLEVDGKGGDFLI